MVLFLYRDFLPALEGKDHLVVVDRDPTEQPSDVAFIECDHLQTVNYPPPAYAEVGASRSEYLPLLFTLLCRLLRQDKGSIPGVPTGCVVYPSGSLMILLH